MNPHKEAREWFKYHSDKFKPRRTREKTSPCERGGIKQSRAGG